jgi:hypothetical protein
MTPSIQPDIDATVEMEEAFLYIDFLLIVAIFEIAISCWQLGQTSLVPIRCQPTARAS